MICKAPSKKDPYTLVVQFLLIWLVFQDFALAIFYKATGSYPITKVLFHTKDILLIALSAWSLFIRRPFGKQTSLVIAIVAYLAICGVWLLIGVIGSESDLTDLIASFRSVALLPLVLLIGLGCRKTQMVSFFRWYCTYFMTFVALFGLLDYALDQFVGTVSFWTETIGFGTYLEEIKDNVLINGLPGNFYGQYGGDFFSQKRLVSFWGTPLTSGYGLLCPVLFTFIAFLRAPKKKARLGFLTMFAIETVALILTFTRATILPLAVALVALVWVLKPTWRGLVIAAMVVGLGVAVTKFDVLFSYVYDGSTVEHIRQVTDSLSQINFFGSGFGSFGIYSSVGTESTYITIIGQIGIIALALYVFVYISSLKRSLLSTKTSYWDARALAITCFTAGIIFFITGFVSEQLTAFTSIAPFFVLLGLEQKREFRYVVLQGETTPLLSLRC